MYREAFGVRRARRAARPPSKGCSILSILHRARRRKGLRQVGGLSNRTGTTRGRQPPTHGRTPQFACVPAQIGRASAVLGGLFEARLEVLEVHQGGRS
jgi:hypothetical protein